jgi:hypothetical protein
MLRDFFCIIKIRRGNPRRIHIFYYTTAASLLSGEIILSYAAKRAGEIIRKLFPFGSRCNSVIGIACCLIVNITTYITYILHKIVPPVVWKC